MGDGGWGGRDFDESAGQAKARPSGGVACRSVRTTASVGSSTTRRTSAGRARWSQRSGHSNGAVCTPTAPSLGASLASLSEGGEVKLWPGARGNIGMEALPEKESSSTRSLESEGEVERGGAGESIRTEALLEDWRPV